MYYGFMFCTSFKIKCAPMEAHMHEPYCDASAACKTDDNPARILGLRRQNKI